MKEHSQDYSDHLKSGQTTLCTCWRVSRSDQTVLGFTDHDVSIEFDNTRFEPLGGFEGAEQPATLGGQTDTGEILGVLRSDRISEQDVQLGRYDNAKVETFRVNWREPTIRDHQRTDMIGEIVREGDQFRAELRSPEHQLNIPKGRRYSHLCDAQLGDARCGIDITNSQHSSSAQVGSVLSRHRISVSGLSGFSNGDFSHGRAVWSDGKRVGLTDQILSHDKNGSEHVLSFSDPVGDWVQVGDQLTLFAGCNRTFSQCRKRFDNALNFRGFPHIPGADAVLRFPKSGDRFSGRALKK